MTATKGTTKSLGQKNSFDKFYTKPEIAAWCLEKLDLTSYSTIIEPSAGNGAFSSQIPDALAFDIAPENDKIITQDWLSYKKERNMNENILVVGNPPFGSQNTLALQFINHAAKFANTVAFIIPRSFRKQSIQNRINSSLHLSDTYDLPYNSFILEGKEADVPCVFQIWSWSETLRETPTKLSPHRFSFVKKEDSPDFSLQRIGGNAGKVSKDWKTKSASSHYFLKAKDKDAKVDLEKDLNKLQYREATYSVGPKSISKQEILEEMRVNGSHLVLLDKS